MKEKNLYYRARNIVYYHEIDTRPRAIWIHALRGLRSDMRLAEDPGEFTANLLSVIPSRVTESEAREIIPGVLTDIVIKYAEQFETKA